MGKDSQHPIPIEISAKTAKQLEQFESYIPQYETLQAAMYEIESLLDYAQVTKTKKLIGEAIHNGELKPNEGALIPYSLWVKITEKRRKKTKPHLDEESSFSQTPMDYHSGSGAIGWYYTQSVVLPLPSFNLEKEFRHLNVTSYPMSLLEDLQGLPLYIPIKNSRYLGVLLTTHFALASEQETIAVLVGANLATHNPNLTCIYSWTFELISKGDKKNASIWTPTFESYRTKEAMDKGRRESRRNITQLFTTISQELKDPIELKACKSAIQTAIYFYDHLPDPQWIAIHKKIALKTNPDTGSIEAEPPEQTPFVVLTKEGNFPLFDPHYVLQIKDDK